MYLQLPQLLIMWTSFIAMVDLYHKYTPQYPEMDDTPHFKASAVTPPPAASSPGSQLPDLSADKRARDARLHTKKF
jgi:hypothetical protein